MLVTDVVDILASSVKMSKIIWPSLWQKHQFFSQKISILPMRIMKKIVFYLHWKKKFSKNLIFTVQMILHVN